ncbi:MAG TPA: CCA tRNA nucleotidyltransferase, partial [Terriglobia bacterium]|nr:CCA tRNA nucleotidyltransferase [Terriglobia bacterium]
MKPDWAAKIVETLRQHGHEAYFVGGCVRDMVMGIEPADYDIATSARPDEITRIFPQTRPVGAQFGVVLVIHRGHPFEVATFRSDDVYIDGRRPTSVAFTDARTDALRRDFTINGLFYDPQGGQVIDFVSGQEDIRARLVRAIGDPHARFQEDKLRILRAIRFGARLDYAIDPATWDAVRAMAPMIHQVSSERIRDELLRILTEGQAARGGRLLWESGLLAEILPEAQWNARLERILALLDRGASPELGMGALLRATPVARAEAVVERLKFSRAEAHHIVALLANAPRFSQVRHMRQHELKRFFRLLRFEDHLELARMWAVAADESLQDYTFALASYHALTPEEITPKPLIS